jgi:hypothetical protein
MVCAIDFVGLPRPIDTVSRCTCHGGQRVAALAAQVIFVAGVIAWSVWIQSPGPAVTAVATVIGVRLWLRDSWLSRWWYLPTSILALGGFLLISLAPSTTSRVIGSLLVFAGIAGWVSLCFIRGMRNPYEQERASANVVDGGDSPVS